MTEINENTHESKWTKESLVESQMRYRRLLENSPDVIFRMSLPDGKFEYINPAVEQLTGYTPVDFYSHPCLPEKLIHPDWMEYFKKEWKTLLKGDMPPFYEYQVIDRAGKTRWFHQSTMVIKDECGHSVAIEGIITDITERKRAEEALRESEEKYRSLAEQVHDGIYIYQGDHFLFTNTHISEISGYSKEELLAIPFIDLVHPDDRAYIWDLAERRLRGEPVPDRYGCRFIRKDGTVRDVEAVVSAIHYKGGYAALGAARDITERKQAEEAIRESEQKYRALFAAESDAIFVVDKETGIIIDCNDAITPMYGYRKEEVVGQPNTSMSAEPDATRAATQEAKGLIPVRYHRRKDGSVFPVEITANVIPVKGHDVIIAAVRDITERKQAEAALQQSEQKYRNIFEKSVTGIFKTTPDGLLIDVNDAFANLYDYSSAAEMLADSKAGGHNYISRYLYANPEERKEIHRILAEKGKIEDYETLHIKRDGTHLWVSITSGIIRDADGTAVFYEGTILDITERKQVEEALNESEKRNRSIVQALPGFIFHISADGRFIDCQFNKMDLLLRQPDQVIGKHVAEILPPDLAHLTERKIRETLDSGQLQTFEYPLILKDEEHFFEARMITSGTDSVLAFVHEITARKRGEAALKKSEERYHNVIEDQNEFICRFLPDGTHIFVNDAYCRYFDRKREDILGHRFRPVLHPEDREMVGRHIASITPEHPVIDIDQRIVMPDGSLRWQRWSDRAIFDPDGRVVEYQSVGRDITEQKVAEEALQVANKKLKLLSSVTRHDVSNQLTILRGYLAFLEKELPDPSQTEYFKKVTDAAQRISAMIQFTREYEQIGVRAPAWQDCRTLVDTAAKEAPLGKVTINNDLPPGIEVFADPLIARVCYNLMDNAGRYGGKITTIRFSVEERNGDHIVVCEDNGDGILAEEKEKIFERGFGKNTGLGLFLSREILDITGITISETGEPGKGARFEMTVPKGMWRIAGKAT